MYEDLLEKIQYKFQNINLLHEALTHPSMVLSKQAPKHYERLEFLGDSVLSLVITTMLINKFPDETEGDLARRRAALISGATLSEIAAGLDLEESVRLSHTDDLQHKCSAKVLENVMEAIIGAIYTDGGLSPCIKFISKHWQPYIDSTLTPPIDAKTYLQEWAQARHLGIPKYKLTSKSGSAHAPEFTIQVTVDGIQSFDATASSKRTAEKKAAQAMIDHLKKE